MKQLTFSLGMILVFALGSCTSSETMTTTTGARTGESGATAAGGINNGNGPNSGFGGVDQQMGPGSVPATGALAPENPYGTGR